MKKLLWFLLLLLCVSMIPTTTQRCQAKVSTTSEYVQVYWEIDCVNIVDHIDWGELDPGEVKNTTVYVKNEGIAGSCYIYVWAYDWIPAKAEKLMHFSWSGPEKVNVHEAVQAVLTLEVSRHIHDVADFSFYIVVLVSEDNIIGDINRDGTVDIFDVITLCVAYDTTPQDPKWNPDVDLNKDWIIDMYDVVIVCSNYGVSVGT